MQHQYYRGFFYHRTQKLKAETINIEIMEITETERLMLVKKKEIICGATLKILEMAHDPKNSLEIKKNFQYILEGLSTMTSYSYSN